MTDTARSPLTAPLRTTVVGSYPQPDWLVDRAMLGGRLPPRVRAREIWRIPGEFLQEAQDDATLIAIRDMERAGIDLITDGEIRRESYSNRFATALDGLDLDNPATITSRSGKSILVPRVVGPIRKKHAVLVEDVRFLRAHTNRMVKVTVPGPFTMTQQAHNDYYADEAALALAYADVVNAEILDLVAAGADVGQIDEPYLQPYPDKARAYDLAAINRALEGVSCQTALHTCFGYAALVSNRPEGYPFLAELSQCDVQQISIETCHLDCAILKSLAAKTIILGVICRPTKWRARRLSRTPPPAVLRPAIRRLCRPCPTILIDLRRRRRIPTLGCPSFRLRCGPSLSFRKHIRQGLRWEILQPQG